MELRFKCLNQQTFRYVVAAYVIPKSFFVQVHFIAVPILEVNRDFTLRQLYGEPARSHEAKA